MEIDKVEEKELEYIRYIDEHCINVVNAYNEIVDKANILNCDEWVKTGLLKLSETIESHDLSKYGDAEFYGYRKYFYPVNNEEKENSIQEFEDAWKHHYSVNEHHWEYWLDDNGNPTEMNEVALLELVCDYRAMGYKFNNTVSEYYTKNKTDIKFHPNTKDKFTYLIDLFEL